MTHILGRSRDETFVGAGNYTKIGRTVFPAKIDNISDDLNKTLLLLLYVYTIKNYNNRDLIIAYVPLDAVKKEFEDLCGPLCKCIVY